MAVDARGCLARLWHSGVAAVSGRQAVESALASDPPFAPDLIVAVGKAAPSMCLGALAHSRCEAIVVTKYGHLDPALSADPEVRLIEAGHPLPDENSLRAGAAVHDAIRELPRDARLLLLVSGGASALAEVLPPDWDLRAWQAMNDRLIASGLAIDDINRERVGVSLIKGGRLLGDFKGRDARVYAISDVAGDDIGTIGSGIGDGKLATSVVATRIVASNALARDRCAAAAAAAGLPVHCNEESLYGDVFELAPRIAGTLACGAPGVYIWGGEPTIRLPDEPGRGGRNQSLALAIAREIAGRDNITVLVAGTDGSDGPTAAAGAIVDGSTFSDTAVGERALLAADAGSYLQAHGELFLTGPTDTNVMDLAIALVQ